MKEKLSAFEKRVKRQVIAKKHLFFVSVSPSFTDICFEEIKKMELEADEIVKVDDGIEITGSLNDCYRLNLFSRTANRILMRVHSFKATSFKTMEQKIKSFPWELYLNPQVEIDVNVTSRKSRLIHSKAVEERIIDQIYQVLSKSEMESEFEEDSKQKIFVRIIEDRFTVSIDSTGENLYRRKVKEIGGPAPLRETIASALLSFAKFDENTYLIDPMCGTGTFSLEAYMTSKKIPAGIYRNFSFEKWPGFRKPGFEYLKKEALKKIKSKDGIFISASDKNRNIVDEFKKRIMDLGFDDGIEVEVREFFKAKYNYPEMKKVLLMFNPPFGKRIGSKGDSHKVIDNIIDKLKSDFKGARFGIILPFMDLSQKIPFKTDSLIFRHGGLKLCFVTGAIE